VQYLKEGLSRIDEGWAAARFDSLPHVVHILTSKDRDGEIQFLKEQSDLIEDVVDEVVHAYHHGFNKAIQNYSQVRPAGRRTTCTFLLPGGLFILAICGA
jgi:exocyst complex component 4